MGGSDEQLVSSAPGKVSGGRQRASGIFGQDIFKIGHKWTVIAGVRWDDWKNFNGSSVRMPLPSGPPVGQSFADRSETSFSPRLSIMRTLSSNLSLSLSGYRAFRAPTLNELYRSFQQGPVLTKSNPLLRAERLTGAEAGLRTPRVNNKIESPRTLFWGGIVDPVTHLTLTTTTHQRQKLGRARSRRGELDGM